MSPQTAPDPLQAEAAAFDARIAEREKEGFLPDLRRARRCEYFYKSCWRDPLFIDLYMGQTVRRKLELLSAHSDGPLRILDVGCGPGFVTLEMARAGHHVTAVDISPVSIDLARKTLAENPYTDGFGSLSYEVASLDECSGRYDCVSFGGLLHHLPDVPGALDKTLDLLEPGGLVLCRETSHDTWTEADAAQVALIRGLLSATGYWYEPGLGEDLAAGRADLAGYVGDVLEEYVHERDKSEPDGQSPHDLSSDGERIIQPLRDRFEELAFEPVPGFIPRLLGGLRGPDETVATLARLLTAYDRLAVAKGWMNSTIFLFLGRKPR